MKNVYQLPCMEQEKMVLANWTAQNTFFNGIPYSFNSRFENEDGKVGANTEELIVTAHNGCFAMALSFIISGAGFTPDALKVDAAVTLNSVEDGFAITGINLQLRGKVSGKDETTCMEIAIEAKEVCPVSKALHSVPIYLDAKFTVF